jgi:mRNA interferase RelE/StbE
VYKIIFKKSAQKELLAIAPAYQTKIISAIDDLANDPRPDGVKKLKLNTDAWRIRIGDYRVIYIIEDTIKIIEIQAVGHRKDIYR